MRYLLDDKSQRPLGFLSDLVQMLAEDVGTLETVFTPVLLGLSERIKNCSMADYNYKYPLEAMAELCDIRLGAPSNRPICNLVCCTFKLNLQQFVSV